MIHYLYIHNDARQARALSTWVALAKAIGRDEAHAALAAAEPLLWSPARTSRAGANVAVRKQAVLHGPDSRPIGTFYEVA
jgi:hypothetical protein